MRSSIELPSRWPVFAALLTALLCLSACNSGGNSSRGGAAVPPDAPPAGGPPAGGPPSGGPPFGDPPIEALSGDPDSLAVEAVADVDEGPQPPESFHDSGVLLSRFGALFAHDATVEQVNTAVAAVEGYIAFSRQGSLLMDIGVPRQEDPAALFDLIEQFEQQPGVVAAHSDRLAATDVLPRNSAGQSVDRLELEHLLPTRFPAAWNAAGRLAGCQANPVTVLVVDNFGFAVPPLFLNQIPPGSFVPDPRGTSIPLLNNELHGYLITLAMAAVHDGAVPTGAHPRADCLRIEQLNTVWMTPNDITRALAERVAGATGNMIVQISQGYGVDVCGLFGMDECDLGLSFVSVQRLQDRLKSQIADSLRWAELGVTEQTTHRVLTVMSAGNYRHKPLGQIYPGFGNARFNYFPQAVEHLPQLNDRYGQGSLLWTPLTTTPPRLPDGTRPWPHLPASVLGEYQRQFDALEKDELMTVPNVVTVGATRLPESSDSGEIGFERAPFSGDQATVHAVGTRLQLGFSSASTNDTDAWNGTSLAAPQVSGLAAYLWLLSDELRGLPVSETIQRIAATSTRVARTVDGQIQVHDVVDAYAAVLALDRPSEPKRIRLAILDVNGDGRFTEADIEQYLADFDARDAQGRTGVPDHSRFDLNGDGFTGGPRIAPFDLSGDEYDQNGKPVLAPFAVRVEGAEIIFDEQGVTDLDALCFFAYQPAIVPYTGSIERRRELLGSERCRSMKIDVIFPEMISGAADLDVLVTLADTSGVNQPQVALPIRFTAECGTLSAETAFTDMQGRANVTVTPEEDCARVSVTIEVIGDPVDDSDTEDEILASTVVSAEIDNDRLRFNGCDYVEGNACPPPFAYRPDLPLLPPRSYSTLVAGAAGVPRSYALIEGALPFGVTLNPVSGDLTGVATQSGEYRFRVRVTAGERTVEFWDSIAILPRVASVEVNPGAVQLTTPPGTATLTATLRDVQGNPLTFRPVMWSTSNSQVATVQLVAGSAVVTARGVGSATITATSGPASGTATVTVEAGALPGEPPRIGHLLINLDLETHTQYRPFQLQHSGGVGAVTWEVLGWRMDTLPTVQFVPFPMNANDVIFEVTASGVLTARAAEGFGFGNFWTGPVMLVTFGITDERGAGDLREVVVALGVF